MVTWADKIKKPEHEPQELTEVMKHHDTKIIQVEAGINILEGQLDLYATKVEVNAIESRVNAAEINIDGLTGQISLKADSALVTSIDTRLGNAEANIDGLNSAIALKAEATEVTSLGTRVTTAEANISALEGQIELKVNASDITGNNVMSLLNLSSTTIRLQASKIQLAGAVTVLSELTDDLGTITAGKMIGVTYETSSDISKIVIHSRGIDGYEQGNWVGRLNQNGYELNTISYSESGIYFYENAISDPSQISSRGEEAGRLTRYQESGYWGVGLRGRYAAQLSSAQGGYARFTTGTPLGSQFIINFPTNSSAFSVTPSSTRIGGSLTVTEDITVHGNVTIHGSINYGFAAMGDEGEIMSANNDSSEIIELQGRVQALENIILELMKGEQRHD